MAYEFDLGVLEGPFATNIDGNALVAEFVLGVDPDADEVYVMSVILLETDQGDKLELCFGIRTKSGPDLGMVSPPDYTKEKTDYCIPKVNRAEVTAKLKVAIELVAGSFSPNYIIMQTYYANLDQKALRKYDAVGASLALLGYLIADAWREQDGINYWLFKKRS